MSNYTVDSAEKGTQEQIEDEEVQEDTWRASFR
jgi:hypothetical protein